jgi:transcriptional regulator with XRE-family HTH domain
MYISKIIKRIRINRELSQEYVSFKLEMSQSQYSRRESGEVRFDIDEIIILSKIFDVRLLPIIEIETNDYKKESISSKNAY